MDASTGPGRRSNGLSASSWGALVDLDPRLSEALLGSLAEAGVPAYVEPASSLDPFSRAALMPARPLDRLWVDPVRADAARAVVAEQMRDLTSLLAEQDPGATAHGFVQPVPHAAASRVLAPPVLPDPEDQRPTGVTPPDVMSTAEPADGKPPAHENSDDPDEAWRRIVEDFGRDTEHAVPPWPVSEDVDPPARTLLPRRTGEPGLRRRRHDPPPPEQALPGWVEPDAVDDDGHYVPPPAPPVPRLAPRKLSAVGAVLVGLLLLFVPSVLDAFALTRSGIFLLGMLLVLGGAGSLVYLMRDAPTTDSGPDDGAVV